MNETTVTVKRRKWPIVVGATLGILVIVGITSTCSDSTQTPTAATSSATGKAKPAAPVLTVKAAMFAGEFDDNQVAAEKKYNGKRVRITAKITNITGGHLAFSDLTPEFSMTQIDCKLRDSDQALTVKNKQAVTITGTVAGQSIGVIEFKDCVVG